MYRSSKLLTADVLDVIVEKTAFGKDIWSVAVDLTKLVNQYNTGSDKIQNDLAPKKLRWITKRPHASWYDDDLRLAKRIKRSVFSGKLVS